MDKQLTEGQIRYRKYKRSYEAYRKGNKDTIRNANRKYLAGFVNTPHGYAVKMYDRIIYRLRFKPSYKGKTLSFTFPEFEKFLVGTDYESLLSLYLASGKKLTLAPSVDRINGKLSYSLDNIRIITQSENSRKGATLEQSHVMSNEILAELESCFKQGLADYEACRVAGISRGTLYWYQRKYPKFHEWKNALKLEAGFKRVKRIRPKLKRKAR